MYELYIEGYKVDIDQKLSIVLTYAIDDVSNYGSRETSFSKQIVIPGTAINNKIFGFIYDLGSFNYEAPGAVNIGAVFNVAQTSRAELRLNGLLVLKGVFRITNIIKDGDVIEYEGAIFGELSGFIAKVGNSRLEDLDFSTYNHTYTRDNIVNSWDGKIIRDLLVDFIRPSGRNVILIRNGVDLDLRVGNQIIVTNAFNAPNNKTYTVIEYQPPINGNDAIIYVDSIVAVRNFDAVTIEFTRSLGSGYFYPLIDYGTYSTPERFGSRVKIDYDYRTFRPALFVKEYIDKIFSLAGYTYKSNFFDSIFFKKLIIPGTSKELKGLFTDLLDVKTYKTYTANDSITTEFITFDVESLKKSFTGNGNPDYTYTGSNENLNINYKLLISAGAISNTTFFELSIIKNSTVIKYYYYNGQQLARTARIIDNINIDFTTNDKLIFQIKYRWFDAKFDFQYLRIKANNPIVTDVFLNDNILLKYSIPKNIFQKDFFIWILKMFNLYVSEDKEKEKHLVIEPYSDFWTDDEIDWTYKVDRSKPWQIKPMGLLNGRYFEYKYKKDTDFYNENYEKKYNLPYGSRLEDTRYEFAKEKQSIEIGFSPTIIVGYENRDKIVSVTYKKSSGNSVQQEEKLDINIRILLCKKMTGINNWYIVNTGLSQNTTPQQLGAALTSYGYAGHFDDPKNPTKDLNFGACEEIYFDPLSYTTNNLFNNYWSEYIAEIADKDSKILTCYVHLTPLDIAQLDFSRPIRIDNVLFRINKIIDYDYVNNELVKVELLKIINNG